MKQIPIYYDVRRNGETLFFTPNHDHNLLAIMVYIILVGLYGSFSSCDKLIVLKQAGLAIIVAILLLIA